MGACKAELDPGSDMMVCACGNVWNPNLADAAQRCKPIASAWVIERKGHAPILTHYAGVAKGAAYEDDTVVTPYISAWPK